MTVLAELAAAQNLNPSAERAVPPRSPAGVSFDLRRLFSAFNLLKTRLDRFFRFELLDLKLQSHGFASDEASHRRINPLVHAA